jgi:hypothetical protein
MRKGKVRNFRDKYWPIFFSFFLFVMAIVFDNPFILCSFSEDIIKIINKCGSLISEGLCFSFAFYYFVDFRPRLKSIDRAKRIIEKKIKALELSVPFIPGDRRDITVLDFLNLDPLQSFFIQLNLPRLPHCPELGETWLSNWKDKIEIAFKEINEYHQFIDIEFFEELENLKNDVVLLNGLLHLLQISREIGMKQSFDKEAILRINSNIQNLKDKL